uniref:Ig-like domain-containing protein n=1 Tax=Lepisosteus oculatus TaxID=7918 RepID=W5LW22_LEPOC
MESDQSQWLFLTLMFLHQSRVSGSERFEVRGPAVPVFVFPGEDAVLPCYLSPDISAVDLEIRWFRKDNFDLVCLYELGRFNFERQNPAYRDRAGLFPEELHRGNVSLTLRDVRRSDHGQYTCMVVSEQMDDDTVIDLGVRGECLSVRFSFSQCQNSTTQHSTTLPSLHRQGH